MRGVDDGVENGHNVAAVEGPFSAGHFIENHAEGEDVGAPIGVFAESLFGRHVGGRADNGACLSEGGLGVFAGGDVAFGEAEVEDLDQAGGRDHDVGGFQIAMGDAGGVGDGEGGGNLAENFERGGSGAEREVVVESLAFDEFHGDEVDAVDRVIGVDGDDVGVIEGAGGGRFAGEAAAIVFRDGVAGDYLEGNRAAELGVDGFIDGAHAALPKFASDFVVGKAEGETGLS